MIKNGITETKHIDISKNSSKFSLGLGSSGEDISPKRKNKSSKQEGNGGEKPGTKGNSKHLDSQ